MLCKFVGQCCQKLEPEQGTQTCLFAPATLTPWPWPWLNDLDVDILDTLHMKNEVLRSRLSVVKSPNRRMDPSEIIESWLHVKWSYFEIILKFFSVLFHMGPLLPVKYNTEMISELFQNNLISRVTTSGTEIKLFQPLKEFWNYFEIISATLNTLENIHLLQ